MDHSRDALQYLHGGGYRASKSFYNLEWIKFMQGLATVLHELNIQPAK